MNHWDDYFADRAEEKVLVRSAGYLFPRLFRPGSL